MSAPVLDISRVTDPKANPLSSGNLANSTQTFAYAVLSVQANALALLQQPAAPALDEALSAVAAQQTAVLTQVRNIRQTLLPEALASFPAASQAVNLMTALQKQRAGLAGPDGGAAELAKLVDAVADVSETNAAQAADVAQDWTRAADQLGSALDALQAQIDKAIEDLDGSDGLLKSTETQIETVAEQIAGDIDAAVKTGQAIGDGLKNLVTGLVTSLTGLVGGNDKPGAGGDKPSAGGDKPDSEGEETGEEPEAAAEDETDDPDGETLPVQGIAAISDAATQAGQVLPNFRKHYAQLAALYQTLAKAQVALAVARAIRTQTGLLAGAVQDAATAATAIQGDWGKVAGAQRGFADELAGPTPPDPTIVAATINAAVAQGWSRLAGRLQAIVAAFTGVPATALPSVKSLTA
jgi:hypothetical protein